VATVVKRARYLAAVLEQAIGSTCGRSQLIDRRGPMNAKTCLEAFAEGKADKKKTHVPKALISCLRYMIDQNAEKKK
jgi:hypothetical protein